jgi:teichuronic acid biosynthesis glycosyltransferase TuaH
VRGDTYRKGFVDETMARNPGDKPLKIVCFSEIQWKYVRTRKQQVITRFPREWRVLFLSSVVKGRRNNFIPERDGNVLHVCVPIFKNFPQDSLKAAFSLAPVRFFWNVLVFLWVNVLLLVTGFGGADRVFYVSNIYYGAVLPLLRRSVMFYDCNDDHLAFPDTPSWAEGYFRRVALEADFAVAVSTGLAERLRRVGVREVHRIGNGVDFELFKEAAGRGIPEEMRSFARPLIGYSGVVAKWFDFGLLDHVASWFPEASIILLGPVFDSCRGELAAVSSKHENIHHLGVKAYADLGGYLSAMDVCIIPLRANELMRLADPNKLYEYAAAARPIVTLKHSEDQEPLRDFVYLAETREEFVAGIEKALAEGPKTELLLDFAKRSSWQARAEAIARLISEAVRRN